VAVLVAAVLVAAAPVVGPVPVPVVVVAVAAVPAGEAARVPAVAVLVVRRGPVRAARRVPVAVVAGAAAPRVPSGVPVGVRRAAGSRRSSGVKSLTTCRRQPLAASRSRAGTAR
jgi:hypothetical protein